MRRETRKTTGGMMVDVLFATIWRMVMIATAATIAAMSSTAVMAEEVTLSVSCTESPHPVNERVYGHFLEHIYHSCNGGLWGEVVWNRSFEDLSGGGHWAVCDGVLTQSDRSEDCRIMLGADPWNTDDWENSGWADYEFTFEARKTGGSEGFLILFRARHEKIFYWFNVGGWNNQYTQLEKCLLYGGKHPIGPRVDFRVESDRWYRFRVRCEGKKYTIWCDDQQLLEFTDTEGVIPTGIVGLGTWNTTAEFRNMKVVSLGGDAVDGNAGFDVGAVLFEGFPEPAQNVNWRYWKKTQGKITPLWGNVANSDVAVRLESIRSETSMGISYEPARMEQENIRVRKDDPLRGSIFARGNGTLVVGLHSLEANLNAAMEIVVDNTQEWTEYPIEFDPEEIRDADAATLILDYLDMEGNHVDVDQVSLMADSSLANDGFRVDLFEAIDGLRPPVIRWPGGCFASCYRWKSGIGPQSARVRHTQNIWDDVDVNSYGTDEFLRMCERIGAQPLIVVNAGSWDKPFTTEKRATYIREACEWIQYCNAPVDTEWGRKRAENGHPEPYGVRLWEMDNETWGMGKEEYCAVLEELIPAVRATAPSVTILICGSGGLGERGDGQDWNRYVIEHCGHLADYVSIHHYEDPGRYAEGPAAFGKFIGTLKEIIAASRNPKLEIYVSEWNLQSTDWRTGLYAGGLLNEFERQGDRMTLGGPALFLRHVSATAWDNAFINFDQNGWFAAPNYVVMQLWREHYAPYWLATDGDMRGMYVSTTKNDAGTVYVKAVNPTGTEKTVRMTLVSATLDSADMKLVAPGGLNTRNTLTEPGAVHVTDAEARIDHSVDGRVVTFTMPPLSAAVVICEQNK